MSERERIQAALPAYEVGVELGRGAWGVVYSARHRSLEREVAVKQLPGAFAADPAVRTRFAHEARLAASLEHPHIVPVYDFLDDDAMCLIVMERCHGSLADRFRTQGLATDEACAAMLALSAGLAYAHRRQVLHRDLKPENLLYGADDLLKLGDFGIARALDASTRLTATGTVMGTPAFMSPEQASGEDLTRASDIYSAGVIFYELLSGELPWGDLASVGAMIRAHLTEPPRPLLSLAPHLPPAVVSVVERAIAKSPGDRYQTAEEFGVAIGEAGAAAFGPGWLRQRRFPLLGAPDIIAATERDVGGAGRAGTVIVHGRTHDIAGVVEAPDLAGPTTEAAPTDPSGQPRDPGTVAIPPEVPATAHDDRSAVFAPPPSHLPPTAPPAGAPPVGSDPRTWAPPVAPPAGAPSGAPPAAPPMPATAGGSGTKRPIAIAVAAAAIVLAGIGAAIVLSGGGEDPGTDALLAGTDTSSDGTDVDRPVDGTDDGGGDDGSSGPGTTGDGSLADADDGADTVTGSGEGLVIGPILSERDSDEGAGLTIQLAVDDINEAGGVLGGPLTLLDPGYSGLDSARFADLGASVIVGPGDPLDSDDAVGASGDSIVISYSDFFTRDFGPVEGFFSIRPRLEHPIFGVVDRLVGDGPVVIVSGALAVSRNGESAAELATLLDEAGRTVVTVDPEAAGKQAVARIVEAAPTTIVFLGVINPSDLYAGLFAAGLTPATTQFLAIGGDGWTSGFDEGELAGIQGMSIDFLTGDALEPRLPATNLNSEAAQAYDAVVISALAAEAAGSAEPAAIAEMLPQVTAGGTVCTTYADCLSALRNGEDIDYDGPSGPIALSAEDGRPTAARVRSSVAGPGILDGDTETIVITID